MKSFYNSEISAKISGTPYQSGKIKKKNQYIGTFLVAFILPKSLNNITLHFNMSNLSDRQICCHMPVISREFRTKYFVKMMKKY